MSDIQIRHWVDSIVFLKNHSCSFMLNWGEDNDVWECSVISSGERLSVFNSSMFAAVTELYDKVVHLCEGNEVITPE